MIYGRDEQGKFMLVPDADGDLWELDWPVCMVDWYNATAYSRWLASDTTLPWRLPEELEGEVSTGCGRSLLSVGRWI